MVNIRQIFSWRCVSHMISCSPDQLRERREGDLINELQCYYNSPSYFLHSLWAVVDSLHSITLHSGWAMPNKSVIQYY